VEYVSGLYCFHGLAGVLFDSSRNTVLASSYNLVVSKRHLCCSFLLQISFEAMKYENSAKGLTYVDHDSLLAELVE